MSGGIDRRRVLCGAGTLVAAELAASACSRNVGEAKAMPVAVAPEDLASGRRLTISVGGNPVEVSRGGSGVTARLLRCTHSGCVVRWNPASRQYLCPCHDGRFDENGNVVEGPPPQPLRILPVSVSADRILVG